ncbi:MAG: sortase and related acyltransferase [Thermoleophilia bacterium]|nr:sortase and related acyltransferase [Thermoleophilia bacterium]
MEHVVDSTTGSVTRATSARHDLVIPKVAPTTRVTVRSFDVDGPAAMVDRFVALGLRLQLETPLRIPQAEEVVRHRLSSDFGWYASGTARHFVATIGGRDIGRCSAMLDPEQRDEDGRQVGLIGQWECEGGEDGASAAHALLELATAWLRDSDAHRIVGPVDFSTWYGYRFLDDPGDGRDPMLTEPVTPSYAIEQWEAFGFTRDETYFSAEIQDPVEQLELGRQVAKILVDQGWKVRQLRMREWDDLMEQAHAMSMEEFTRQPYFTPISLDDFRAMYAGVKRGVDPRYVFTAWSPEGDFAGYVFGVRDLSRAARALQSGGIRSKVAALREAWNADTMMVKTICVAKPYRKLGITILVQHALYAAAMDTGHSRVCNMLMHCNNRSRDLTALAGGKEYRTYVTLKLDA